jgi:hypothetical protein
MNKGFCVNCGWWLMLGLLTLAPARGSAQSKEYQVKAAFLFNFARFIDWPPSAFTNASQPFQIGILGDNPFGTALNDLVLGENLRARKVTVKLSAEPQTLADCQIIFISKSETNRAPEVISQFRSRPILTVGEIGGVGRCGTMISFYQEDRKLRFEIDPDAAEKAGIKMSSQLLRLGKLTRAEPGTP